MQVKICIFLIMLLVVPNMCMQQKHFSRASQTALQKLKSQQGTWASFLVNLAEVHLSTGGPLDELLEAIEEVITDLSNKLERAHDQWDIRTENHISEVSRIQSLIDSATTDVSSTTEYIQTLNYQLAELAEDVVRFERELIENQESKESSIEIRASQNEEYLVKVPEHTQAIAAIDEALEVFSQLITGEVSLIQMKSLKKSFDTINKKVPAGQDGSILKALMQVASDSKFADQGAVLKVAQIMREVRSNLTASLAQIEEDEASQQVQHNADLSMFDNNEAKLSTELVETNEQITLTQQYVADSEEFLETRKADKATAEQDLQDENDSYVRDQEAYEDLVKQFTNELNACSLALEHLNSADIADYIGGRMEQDVVIDSNHGSDFTVETNAFDLQ